MTARASPRFRAGLVFAACCLISMTYYASWLVWRWSNLPAVLFALGSLPWTLPWFCWLEEAVNHSAGWRIRYCMDILLTSFAFSLNCALGYSAVATIGARLRKYRRAVDSST